MTMSEGDIRRVQHYHIMPQSFLIEQRLTAQAWTLDTQRVLHNALRQRRAEHRGIALVNAFTGPYVELAQTAAQA